MSDHSSVFSDESSQTTSDTTQQTQSAQEQSNDVTQAPAYADRLKQIVNENGEPKYKDVDTALDALGHSQKYIDQLKQELADARKAKEAEQAEEDRLSTIQDTLKRLTESQQNNQPTPPEFQGLTEDQIASLLEDRLSKHEQQKVAQANVERVSQAIRQQFGDKTQEAVAQKAAAYGMSAAEFEQMAAKSPQMVLDIFGVKPHQSKQSLTSSVNVPPINPQSTELAPPDKSILRGARTKDVVERMRLHKEHIYRQHGITE